MADKGTWGTAALFQFIPIIGPIAVQGWHAEILQRLVKGHPQPVAPLKFDDLMKLLSRGLPAFLVALVAGGIFGLVIGVPMGCLGGVMSAMLGASGGGGEEGGLAAALFMMFAGVMMFTITLPAGMMINGATLRAELTEDFSASLKFGEVWDYVKRTWVTQLVAGIGFAFFAWLMAFAGMLVCFVGIYAVVPMLSLGALHLRFQMYQLYLSRGGSPIPMKVDPMPMAPPGGGGYAPTY